MDKPSSEWDREAQHLRETVSLARTRLEQAIHSKENHMAEIADARRELRENAAHGAFSLSDTDGFEALVELNQYLHPIMTQTALAQTTDNRIAALERLVDSPYFARIDFRFADEAAVGVSPDAGKIATGADEDPTGQSAEQVYIGRTSLMKEDSPEMAVYDWRSPIAGLYYRFSTGPAFYEAPAGRIEGEVLLKRQYEIRGGELQYFFDAGVEIVDEYLRKLLSQNTSPAMKTIVESIQKEQDAVIRDVESDLLMVQGAAGSGKTSIALHRAAYLMYQGLVSGFTANNILILSPNTLFAQYISHVLPELGESNAVSLTLDAVLASILKKSRLQTRSSWIEKWLTEPREQDLMRESITWKTSLPFAEMLRRLAEAALRGAVRLTADPTEPGFDAKELYTRLFDDRALFDRLAGEVCLSEGQKPDGGHEADDRREPGNGCEPSDERRPGDGRVPDRHGGSAATADWLPARLEEILQTTRDKLYAPLIHYDDVAAIALLQLKLAGTNRYAGIRQVLIDEAQDYYPIHFELFRLLFTNTKYTILGDVSQALDTQVDIALYEQIADTLRKKKSTLAVLDKSFRCTKEILRFAAAFLPHNLQIESFNRSGAEPGIHVASDRAQLYALIAAELEVCREAGYRSIGLLCKTEQNAVSLHRYLRSRIDLRLIRSGQVAELEGTMILPLSLTKGLEFDAVLLCDADSENYRSESDQRLLYIACTRALHRLNLYGVGQASPLLTTPAFGAGHSAY